MTHSSRLGGRPREVDVRIRGVDDDGALVAELVGVRLRVDYPGRRRLAAVVTGESHGFEIGGCRRVRGAVHAPVALSRDVSPRLHAQAVHDAARRGQARVLARARVDGVNEPAADARAGHVAKHAITRVERHLSSGHRTHVQGHPPALDGPAVASVGGILQAAQAVQAVVRRRQQRVGIKAAAASGRECAASGWLMNKTPLVQQTCRPTQ